MDRNKAPIATRVALGLILAAGLALRLWYGGFGLRLDRFQDEQHSWPNVQSILETGTLAPVKYYYPYPLFNLPPAALIAVGEKLSSTTNASPWTAVTAGGTVTPRAIFLCRIWPVFYGTLAIFLTFLLGRRVFSDSAGLVGALLLAFSPQAIHSSGYFKPDSQLLCMTLLALLLALRAVERPTAGRYALAGLGVTLAASSKALSVVVAVPLVVATLITAWRRHRDLLLLGVAGLSSALSFVLINPYWRLYPEWLVNIRYHYAIQAKARGLTQLSIPWRTVKLLLEPAIQNPWLSGIGLLGFLGLIVWLCRNRDVESQWLSRLMFLTFPIVYVAAYSLTTAYLKSNNFLVLLPFVFLVAGWVLVSIWGRAGESWGFLSRPRYSSLAGAGLAVLAVIPGITYTYCALVPPTSLLAQHFLARRAIPPDGRVLLLEDPRLDRPGWEGWPRRFARNRAAFKQIDSAREMTLEDLRMTDGLAVASASLEQSDAQALSDWLASLPPDHVRTFEPRLFRARGPAMTAASQTLPRLEPQRPLDLKPCLGRQDCLSAEIPASLLPGQVHSLIVYIRQAHFDRSAGQPDIRVGGQRVNLAWTSWIRDTQRHRFNSSRVDLRGKESRVVIESEGHRLRPQDFRIELCRWQRPASAP